MINVTLGTPQANQIDISAIGKVIAQELISTFNFHVMSIKIFGLRDNYDINSFN